MVCDTRRTGTHNQQSNGIFLQSENKRNIKNIYSSCGQRAKVRHRAPSPTSGEIQTQAKTDMRIPSATSSSHYTAQLLKPNSSLGENTLYLPCWWGKKKKNHITIQMCSFKEAFLKNISEAYSTVLGCGRK